MSDLLSEARECIEAMQADLKRHRKAIMEIWGLRAEGVTVPNEVLEITRKYWNANCGPFDRAAQATLDKLASHQTPDVRHNQPSVSQESSNE